MKKFLFLLLFFSVINPIKANECSNLAPNLYKYISDYAVYTKGALWCSDTDYTSSSFYFTLAKVYGACGADGEGVIGTCGRYSSEYIIGVNRAGEIYPMMESELETVDKFIVNEGMLFVYGKDYGSDDPTCCPTKNTLEIYEIKNKSLKKITYNEYMRKKNLANTNLPQPVEAYVTLPLARNILKCLHPSGQYRNANLFKKSDQKVKLMLHWNGGLMGTSYQTNVTLEVKKKGGGRLVPHKV